MALEQLLGKYATSAAALALIVAMGLARALTSNDVYRRDLRSAQGYLTAFLGTSALRAIIPVRWATPDKLLYVAGLVLFAFGAIHGAAATWIHFHRRRTGADTPKIVRDLIDAALFLVALLVILQATLEIDLSTLLASSAVLSLVLGLALQETLGNLFAGLSLQAERPFKEGDWIRIGAHTGRVLEIGWRATRMLTGAAEVVTIPNNAVAKEAIYNFSARGAVLRTLRVGLGVAIAPNVVKDVVLELLRSHPRIVQEPAPAVRTTDLGTAAITYELQFWVARPEEGGAVEDEVRTQLWYRLRRAGMELPGPTTQVPLSRAGGTAPAGAIDPAALLARVELLSAVPEPARAALARRANVVRFGRGEVILRQGDAGPGPFYVVAQGEVAVRVRGSDGREHEIARLGPGDFFGEMSVLTGEPRTATVAASADTALVAVDREAFSSLFAAHPEAAHGVAEVLSRRREALARAMRAVLPEVPSGPAEPRDLLDRLREIFEHLR